MRLRRILRVVAVGCVAGATVLFGAGSASAQNDPPYRFDADSAAALPATGTEATEVVLLNDSSRPFRLSAQATLHTTPAALPVTVTPSEFDLAPGETRRLALTRPETGWDKKATLTGYLTVSAANDPTLPAIHRAISLGPAKRTPAVDSRTLVVYESVPLVPGTYWLWHEHVPLKGSSCPEGAEPVRTELSDGPHSAPVQAECVLIENKPMLTIALPQGLPAHGTFKGTLDVDGTKLGLEVRYSTLFVWPLLILLAGTVVSLLLHRWVSRREELRGQERILAVATLVDDAQRAFQKASQGQPSVRYSITPAATEELARVLAEAKRLSSGALFRTRDTGWDDVLGRADEVEAYLVRWRKLPENLATARSALDANPEALAVLPKYSPWVTSMVEGTVGGAALDLAEVRELLDEAAAVPSVIIVAATFVRANALRSAYQDGEIGSAELRERAREVANEAGAELRQADRATKLAESGTAARVSELVDLVERLTPAEPVAAGLQGVDGVETPIDPVELAKAREDIDNPESARSGVNRRRLTGDRLVVGLVSLLALWTGFQLYLGKPWGTPVDYLGLAAWAYGAPTVLTPLIQALERLSQGPLRRGASDDNDSTSPAA